MKDIYVRHIASLLQVKDWQVENCAELFAEGCTIPFISRYRKERTGGLTDVEVAEIKIGEHRKNRAVKLVERNLVKSYVAAPDYIIK